RLLVFGPFRKRLRNFPHPPFPAPPPAGRRGRRRVALRFSRVPDMIPPRPGGRPAVPRPGPVSGRKAVTPSVRVRWAFGLGIAPRVTAVPYLHYRWVYTHGKRLREVTPGVLYRSGQMTADGFAEAVERHGIRTFVNLQDEYPDPDIPCHYFGGRTVK